MATTKKTSHGRSAADKRDEARVNAEFDALEAADKAAERRAARVPSVPAVSAPAHAFTPPPVPAVQPQKSTPERAQVEKRIADLKLTIAAEQGSSRAATLSAELADLERQLAATG